MISSRIYDQRERGKGYDKITRMSAAPFELSVKPQTKHTLKYSLASTASPVLIEPKIQHGFKIQPGAWN